jgi:hypothetical protein
LPALVGDVTCYDPLSKRVAVDCDAWSAMDSGWLARVARAHGFAPWLYQVVRTAGSETSFSPEDLRELEAAYDDSLERDRRQRGRLAEVDGGLRRRGIAYLLLKEYAIDGTYPVPGCVTQGDLDLLVRPADLAAACGVLESLGYQRVSRPWKNEYRYKRSDGACIDLQVSLNPALGWWAEMKTAVESLFTRACPLQVETGPVLVLDPVDNARFLITHAAMHHNFTPFSKIVHTWNYLVRYRDQIDAEKVREAFRAARLENLYDCAAWYLEQLVGRPFPLFQDRTIRASRPFQHLMPAPAAYFSHDVSCALARRWRDGWQLLCFLDTWPQKAACLLHIVRARAGQRLRMRGQNGSTDAQKHSGN